MPFPSWSSIRTWLKTPGVSPLDLRQQEWRMVHLERDIGLPVKAILIAILFYYLFGGSWRTAVPVERGVAYEGVTRSFTIEVVQYLFLLYVAVNVGAAFILAGMQQLPRGTMQWTVFFVQALDAAFLGAMVLITGGMESLLFWLFLLLVVRHCLCFNTLAPQALLNSLLTMVFVAATCLDVVVTHLDNLTEKAGQPPVRSEASGRSVAAASSPSFEGEASAYGRVRDTLQSGPFLLRLGLLVFASAWCSLLQALIESQRRQLEEQQELALRRAQLQTSGRLAAEIAHQLKNPLAIINNASYTLQKTVKEGKTITQQIQIIREEVDRSDRLITELMGYAQLVEGRVERLDVKEELEHAIARVFPPAVHYEIGVHRDYAPGLPNLLAQRNHLEEVFVNVMQNAREAMQGRGHLWVSTAYGENHSIVVTIRDDGPGIPPEHLDRIFEAYFTTRERGSGLGLSIVKHNTEMYGGRVHVESELGKGTCFTLSFPARTLMRLRK